MGPAPCGDGGVDQEEAVHMGQEGPSTAQEEVLHIAPPTEPPLDNGLGEGALSWPAACCQEPRPPIQWEGRPPAFPSALLPAAGCPSRWGSPLASVEVEMSHFCRFLQ